VSTEPTTTPSETPSPGEIRAEGTGRGPRLLVALALWLAAAGVAAANPVAVRAAWQEIESVIQLKSSPLPASAPKLSDHEIAELPAMDPQQQAQLLMERAINHYDGAIEIIDKNVPSWYGRVEVAKGPLAGLLDTAINANDLRVRAAALEITLAGYNLPKSPETVDTLLARLQDEPEHRAWLLWILGVVGNRGVETSRIELAFLDRAQDSDQLTRTYVAVGLGLLATDNSIPVLLRMFREDPSPQVRERAACSLAQSGMFTQAQRMSAVPELMKMMDDPSLDAATRSWVFQALSDITGASIASDPAAWRFWWSEHARG
jgi:HEAT repeat protein